MKTAKKFIPVKPDLESQYGITREIQILYDIFIEKGDLSYELMKQSGLSYLDIITLLKNGVIKKDPDVDKHYFLRKRDNLEPYKLLIRSNPSITTSPFVEKYLPKLVSLYEVLMSGNALTSESLNNAGIDNLTIKEFVKRGILQEPKDNEYGFLDFNRLLVYGNYLHSINETDEAIKCHNTCRMIDKNCNLFRPIFISILLSNYSKALYLLGFFDVPFASNYRNDYNFYLYLLSFLTTLPQEKNAYVRTLKLEDILSLEENSSIPNEIRELIFKKKYSTALTRIDALSKTNDGILSELSAIKKFVETIYEDQNQWKKGIVKSIKSGNIGELINYLRNENKKRRLEVPFNYFYEIAKDILQIRKTDRAVPRQQDSQEKTLLGFIRTKNYMKAYCKCVAEGIEKGIPDEKNYMLMLLRIIVEEQYLRKTPTIILENNIIFYLQHDKRVSLKVLETYLTLHGRTKYLPVLTKMILLCILIGDEEYKLFSTTLRLVINTRYNFPYEKYMDALEQSIERNLTEISECYFEVIVEMLKVQPDFEVTNKLKKLREQLGDEEPEAKPLNFKPIN